jgi:hypothetical protein
MTKSTYTSFADVNVPTEFLEGLVNCIQACSEVAKANAELARAMLEQM